MSAKFKITEEELTLLNEANKIGQESIYAFGFKLASIPFMVQSLFSENNPLNIRFEDSFDLSFSKDNAVEVPQHHVSYTSCNSNQPVLGSYGAGPCVIVALYNPENKNVALSHIDAGNITYTLRDMISQIDSKKESALLEAHITGGSPDRISIDNQVEILNELKLHNITIKSSKLGYNDSNSVKDLAIDSCTGKIYTDLEGRNQLLHGENYDQKLEKIFHDSYKDLETPDGTKSFLSKKMNLGVDLRFDGHCIECREELSTTRWEAFDGLSLQDMCQKICGDLLDECS